MLALRSESPPSWVCSMSRVVKRSTSQPVKAGPSRRSRPNSPLPQFVPPQLSQPVEKPPSGPQWLHEIKLDGFRMAARIDNSRAFTLEHVRSAVHRALADVHELGGAGARNSTLLQICRLLRDSIAAILDIRERASAHSGRKRRYHRRFDRRGPWAGVSVRGPQPIVTCRARQSCQASRPRQQSV